MIIGVQLEAQFINFLHSPKISDFHQEEVSIHLDGKPLRMRDSSKHSFTMGPGIPGNLSISNMSKTCSKGTEYNAIGFKLAVKDKKTNTIWMYTEETIYEIDLQELIEQCDFGDSIIFMTIDKKYKLPINEIVVMDGC